MLALLILRPWERGDEAEGPAPATAPVDAGRRRRHPRSPDRRRAEDVRLIGVDTPETVKPDTPGAVLRAAGLALHPPPARRPHGAGSCFGVERRDIYGRLLAYVHLGDRFVNAMLVRRGLARTLTIPPNDRYAPLFRRLEIGAARAGRGLWGACRP